MVMSTTLYVRPLYSLLNHNNSSNHKLTALAWKLDQ